MPEDISFVQRLEKRRTALINERDRSWIPHWRQISRWQSPRMSRFFKEDANDGRRRDHDIINNTGGLASRTLRSGMNSGLTSPSRPWFLLQTPDPDLNELDEVKHWLHQVTQNMRDVFSKSNLYNALPVLYGHLGDYGTGIIVALEDPVHVVRFENWPIGSFALATGADGKVDTAVRELKLTVDQLVERFGIDAVSPSVRTRYENSSGSADWVDVVHWILPNRNRKQNMADARNMKFLSVWYEAGTQRTGHGQAHVLKVSGYNEFPAMAPRWEVNGEDVYGSNCPGMMALGDIKELQHHEQRSAQGLDKLVEPPMVGHPSLKGHPTNMLPGGVTFTEFSGSVPGFQPAYQINPHLNEIDAKIAKIERRISRAFYEDLFLLLAQDDRSGITAREVQERHEEKLLMLGPVLERLNDELLTRLIDRTFNIMLRAGLIPEPPEALEGVDLKIEFVSILAQAQKAIGITSIERLASFAGNIGSIRPDALDKVDWDQMIDEAAEDLGTPPRLIISDDRVAALREERAARENAAMAAQMGVGAADAAKTLSETSLESDSALRAIGAQ